MNIFDHSPILRVLEDLGATPDWQSTWWTDAVCRALQSEAPELQDESIDFPSGRASPRPQ